MRLCNYYDKNTINNNIIINAYFNIFINKKFWQILKNARNAQTMYINDKKTKQKKIKNKINKYSFKIILAGI